MQAVHLPPLNGRPVLGRYGQGAVRGLCCTLTARCHAPVTYRVPVAAAGPREVELDSHRHLFDPGSLPGGFARRRQVQQGGQPLGANVVELDILLRQGNTQLLEVLVYLQHDDSGPHRSQHLVIEKVVHLPAGEFLISLHRILFAWSTLQPRNAVTLAVHPVEQKEESQVGLWITQVGHLPIQQCQHTAIRAVNGVRHPGVAPAQGDALGCIRVLPQPVEGRLQDRLRLLGGLFVPGQIPLPVVELPVKRVGAAPGHAQEGKPRPPPVNFVDFGQRLN